MDSLVKDLKYEARKNANIFKLASKLKELIMSQLETDMPATHLKYKVEAEELYIIDDVVKRMGLLHELFFTERGEAFTHISLINFYIKEK